MKSNVKIALESTVITHGLPGTVVCAGAKSILDLPRTRERLETDGVTVLGCGKRTDAFSAESSGGVDKKPEFDGQPGFTVQQCPGCGSNRGRIFST